MSSVTVVGNSLLLGRYTPKFAAIKKNKQVPRNPIIVKSGLKALVAAVIISIATFASSSFQSLLHQLENRHRKRL